MFYITGDTHGDQNLWDACISPFLKEGDTIIVAGDFGIGFFEETFLDHLEMQRYTVCFCDGNHENFKKLNGYDLSEWNGGKVHFVRPNLIHLMRGEIYEIDGKSLFVMGGGYSIDKCIRIPGISWWPDEMPTEDDYRNAKNNLERKGFMVDYVLTHTAPTDTVEYMLHMNWGIKNMAAEEYPLTGFFRWVEDVLTYNKWYFGHFHIDAELWKGQYALFDGIRDLHTGNLVRIRSINQKV